jgi:hypothetical protein
MSERHRIQDPTGVFYSIDANLIGWTVSTTTPTNSKSGYLIGSVWVNKTGTAGSIFYVNTGTATSTTWTNIA